MDKEELKASINIIFEKEVDDLSNFKLTYMLKKKNEDYYIKYEHSDTLIEIYSDIQSNEDMKNEFIKTLEKYVEESNDGTIWKSGKGYSYISLSSLCFYTLIRLGLNKNAINSLKNRGKKAGVISGNIFQLFYCIFNEKETYFKDLKEINELIEILKELNWCDRYNINERDDAKMYKNSALSILRSSAYNIVKRSIKKINIEINKDKKEVETIIKYLNFDNKYNRLLGEIDKFINTESEILSSGMIGNLRSFMEDLLTDIAKKIASVKNEEIPKYENLGHMGNIRTYLKINLELSDNDNSLINKFIDVLHNNGGHSFVSNKDYFRLSKNIAIEISLLLLSKYQSKYIKSG